MTVSVPTYTEKTWQGDGSTTVFNFQTRVDEAADLKVWLIENDIETLKSLTTHYMLSGVGSPDGVTVTMLTAPTAEQKAKVRRETVSKQTINYTDIGKVPGDTTEGQLDRLAMALQDVANRLGQIETAGDIQGAIADFEKRYLGAFAADPTADNDGNPLTVGALYFNTIAGTFRVWTGVIWQDQDVTLGDGDVTAPKLSDLTTEQRAMAFKLGIQTNGDYSIEVNGTTGDDTTGDGSVGAPFATWQRAWDSLPWLVKDKVVINIANGTYGTSSRSAASLDRPALLYLDGKKLGRRTDGPGGVMTGSVTFRGQSKAGVVLQPGSVNGYTRGIYQTGHVGSVAFQNFTIDALTGAEAGIVAHRGAYTHVSDVDIDGNGFMTFGMIAEAGGKLEGLVIDTHHCVIGANAYLDSSIQLSLSSSIHDCSSQGINIPIGGTVGLTTGSLCSSSILVSAGGKLETTGISSSRVTLSGSLEMRGGAWAGAFIDASGTITTRPGSTVNLGSFGWSNQWVDYGGELYLPGGKSYTSPATQSTVATPLIFLGESKNLYVDATFQIINNAGVEISESIGGSAISVPGNNQAFSSPVRGRVNVANLTAAASRTGITFPVDMPGRSAGALVPAGTVLEVVSNSASTIQLVPGGSGDFGGVASITIGTAAGSYMGARAVMGTTGLWRVTPMGAVRT